MRPFVPDSQGGRREQGLFRICADRPRCRRSRLPILALLAIVTATGCAEHVGTLRWPAEEPGLQKVSVAVPVNAAWVDSGVDVTAGEPVTIRADGSLYVGASAKGNYDDQMTVGPEGTFLYSEKIAKHDFPLASAAGGPAPCYCLIGQVGAL